MHNRDRALDFLKHFCAGDVDALPALLADDLQVTGPLFQFNARAAYLKSLRDDPSEPCVRLEPTSCGPDGHNSGHTPRGPSRSSLRGMTKSLRIGGQQSGWAHREIIVS